MIIDPLHYTRIGIATISGRAYYKFTQSLKELDVHFDSILPEHIDSYSGNIIFTTKKEAPSNSTKPMLNEEIFEKHSTVVKGLILQKLDMNFEEDKLVLGVDPGSRIGLSVFYFGKEIESSLFSSVDGLVSHIITILAELKAKQKIVKIGDGNMRKAQEIGSQLNLHFCSSFELEYVDERKTSLKIKNYNQRGKRDKLSAKYISQRDGYRHLILPLSITG